MSRIGNRVLTVPESVTVTLDNNEIKVTRNSEAKKNKTNAWNNKCFNR